MGNGATRRGRRTAVARFTDVPRNGPPSEATASAPRCASLRGASWHAARIAARANVNGAFEGRVRLEPRAQFVGSPLVPPPPANVLLALTRISLAHAGERPRGVRRPVPRHVHHPSMPAGDVRRGRPPVRRPVDVRPGPTRG